jgi:outer membrane protein OmpA-like peptidoglycan-associated protein
VINDQWLVVSMNDREQPKDREQQGTKENERDQGTTTTTATTTTTTTTTTTATAEATTPTTTTTEEPVVVPPVEIVPPVEPVVAPPVEIVSPVEPVVDIPVVEITTATATRQQEGGQATTTQVVPTSATTQVVPTPVQTTGEQADQAESTATARSASKIYVVTFATNSTDLSPNAPLVIKNAAQSISDKQYTLIRVMGFAPEGTDEEANKALSLQRARAVARELVRNGVDRTKIRLDAYGSRNPRFPSDTPESNVRNQRVEIVVSD